MMVLVVGIVFASLGYDPIQLIVFAQYANGLILPIIVLLLMFAMNKKETLHSHVNPLWMNIVGWVIFLITVSLAILSIL